MMSSILQCHVITYFVGVCLISISLLVFVNASVSFVITDIIGKTSNVGDDVGTLGFADELLAIFACPLWGMLSDRIGPRIVVTLGYTIIAVSLICFVNATKVYPDLLLIRLLFSLGGAAVSTMVTAILPAIDARPRSPDHTPMLSENENEDGASTATSVGTLGQQPLPTSPQNRLSLPTIYKKSSPDQQGSRSFLTAGIVGTAAGCGALLAVFGFLRLPLAFQRLHLDASSALRKTYYIVAGISVLAASLCVFGLQGLRKLQRTSDTEKTRSFLTLPQASLMAAYHNDSIALSYLGGFVARASSVGISLFIPLWVNAFYIEGGRCHIDDPSQAKHQCTEAYKLASILTGVSQLAALAFAPIWGFITARRKMSRSPLILTATCGVAGYFGLSIIDDPRLNGGLHSLIIISLVILVGTSQIGAIVCSLGLLGSAVVSDEAHIPTTHHTNTDREPPSVLAGRQQIEDAAVTEATESQGLLRPPVSRTDQRLEEIQGSIAGAYSFAGGLGILLLTKIGGIAFDSISQTAPFVIMAIFNVLLIIGSILSASSIIRHRRGS